MQLVTALALLVFAAGTHADSQPVEQLATLLKSLADADERAIDSLFSKGCRHLYLDVGTNIGVQIRKLYQPRLYPNATVLPLFDRYFGSAPRCHVCAIGFEPNPVHSARLNELESRLRSAGANVLILRAAASSADSVAHFALNSKPGTKDVNEDWSASMAFPSGGMRRARYLSLKYETTVRTVSLKRILQHAHRAMGRHAARNGRVFAKFDAEGEELAFLPDLLRSQSLCNLVDGATVEWHEPAYRRKYLLANARKRGLKRGEDGATAVLSVVGGLRAAIESAINASYAEGDCRTQYLSDRLEDETYLHDGMPWPTESVCS